MPGDEWLRLRDDNGIFSVTYKNWHHGEDGKSTYCDEYETIIKNIGQAQLIFKALDMKELAKVEKQRSKYRYGDYEISIDKVKDLGDFVELEYSGHRDAKEAKVITDEMVQFLKKLGVGKIYRNYVGYPFQILFPNDLELEEY